MSSRNARRFGIGASTIVGILALATILIRTPHANPVATVASPVPPAAQLGILDQILTLVRDARNEARDSADSAREIRDRVRIATGSFSGQMQDAIEEAIEDVGRELAEELDGRDEFLAGGVESFRQDLIALLRNTESVQNTLSSIAGGPADVLSLDRLIGIVEGLSGRALFPLYRVLASDSGILNSGIAQKLADAAENLMVLGQILQEPSARSEALVDPCAFISANPEAVRFVTYELQTIGAYLKVVGGILNLVGKRKFVELQVHGYVGASLESDLAIKVGTAYNVLGDLLLALANFSWNKIRFCQVQGRFDVLEISLRDLLDGQQQLLAGQADLATLEGQRENNEHLSEIKAILEELLRRLPKTRYP